MKNNLGAALCCLCFSLFLFGCQEATTTTKNPEVPAELQVAATEIIVYTALAEGVQTYSCDSVAPNQYQWKLKAPDAILTDEKGNKIGTHGAGPFWATTASATDKGSKVVGDGNSLKRFPSPDTTAIPWLRITIKAREGEGALGNVTTIQRVKTVGGKAPTTVFDKTYAGKELRVPYKATYYFYAPSK